MEYLRFKPKQAGWLEEHVSCLMIWNVNTILVNGTNDKKHNKTKPKKGEDPKMMCNKVVWRLSTAILDNKLILIHHFLVHSKLYKSELMQAQFKAEVNDTYVTYASLTRITQQIESGREGVMQVGQGKIVLTNIEFKQKCHTCEKYRYI